MPNFFQQTYLARLSHKERSLLSKMLSTAQPIDGAQVAKMMGLSHPNSVRVAMSRIRARLRGTGWTITTNTGGPATNTGLYLLELNSDEY